MAGPPQRFLILRLSSIGDIVHALPAAAALAATFPDSPVDWVVEQRHAQLLQANPHVQRVLELDTLGWRNNLMSPGTWREIRRGVGALRERDYEAAFDFQGLWKSAVAARVSRARARIGFTERWLREPGAAVLYTQKVAPPLHAHVVEENLALLERVGVRAPPRREWQFPLPRNRQDDEYIEQQLNAIGGDFIIVNPGGGWRAKCWAPENYAMLIRAWTSTRAEQVILTGSAEEGKGLLSGILQSAASPQAHYIPATVLQFVALARRARLFIGGDTGPLHLAAAVGTPVVGIYGPTDPARNGPFAADDIVLWNQGRIDHTRRGGNTPYLPGIDVGSVMASAAKRLARVHG